ncbi:myeloid cell nuclear differentiation antigen [Ochotona princeps]|uniref:myeloid cell nuclear differentiation antigen n=1 Tax=Ochotona princeps TaxID=9978 RepID=UPI002714AC31|nr:myeloid cell nuclear differentiation antigen [Ochotona princeps]
MESKYRQVVLLKGLNRLRTEQLHTIMFILAPDLKINKDMQDKCDRIKIADLMADMFPVDAGLSKLIEIFKDTEELKDLAKELQTEKLKIVKKYKCTSAKETPPLKKKNPCGMDDAASAPATGTITSTQGVKKTAAAKKILETIRQNPGTKRKQVPEGQACPPSLAEPSTSTDTDHVPPPQISSSTPNTPSTKKSRHQLAARQREQPKDPKIVMVLKATGTFEYEISEEEKGKMFHATVATKTELFQVKVLDTSLKELFTKDNVIIISNYFKEKGILEINETSSVSKAGPDQKIEIPNDIKRRATTSPTIAQLQRQKTGTIVYGSFKLHKKTVRRTTTTYEIEDKTGKMEVVGRGQCYKMNCEEGDTLHLFCFQLKTVDKTMKLKSGIHSFIKVFKAKKHRNTPVHANLNQNAFQEMMYSPSQLHLWEDLTVETEALF